MPVTAMAAAHAMLLEPDLVPARKRRNAERRADLMRFFDAHGFATRPSVSNKLMVDARMPTQQVIDGLKQRKVYVGRPGRSGRRTCAFDRNGGRHGALPDRLPRGRRGGARRLNPWIGSIDFFSTFFKNQIQRIPDRPDGTASNGPKQSRRLEGLRPSDFGFDSRSPPTSNRHRGSERAERRDLQARRVRSWIPVRVRRRCGRLRVGSG